jgi:predicted solute-binding protein
VKTNHNSRCDINFPTINLYVNEFSLDIGQEGESAIETLFAKARGKGILPNSDKNLFACNDYNRLSFTDKKLKI